MSEKDRLELEQELLMTCSKSQAINKYIDELEENTILTTQWLIAKQSLEQLKIEIKHYKKVINHLSRVIQNKNKKYKKLELRKMPNTLYGREVIVVPDSKLNEIMIVNKEVFNNYMEVKND